MVGSAKDLRARSLTWQRIALLICLCILTPQVALGREQIWLLGLTIFVPWVASISCLKSAQILKPSFRQWLAAIGWVFDPQRSCRPLSDRNLRDLKTSALAIIVAIPPILSKQS